MPDAVDPVARALWQRHIEDCSESYARLDKRFEKLESTIEKIAGRQETMHAENRREISGMRNILLTFLLSVITALFAVFGALIIQHLHLISN